MTGCAGQIGRNVAGGLGQAGKVIGSAVALRAVTRARVRRIGHVVGPRGGLRSGLEACVLRTTGHHLGRYRVRAHAHPHVVGVMTG